MKVASLSPTATGMFSGSALPNSTLGQTPQGVRIVENSKMTIQRTQSTLPRQTELNMIPSISALVLGKRELERGLANPKLSSHFIGFRQQSQ